MYKLPTDIPEEMKALNQWVCWRDGSKVPMRAWENEPASASDPATWCDYKTALQSVMLGLYDGIGFVFNNNGIVGIDIDDGFTEEGFMTDKAHDIINRCGSTYVELSKSGRGFHIYLLGKLPFDGANNRDGVEIYQSGRWFIVTGHGINSPNLVDGYDIVEEIVDIYFATETRKAVKNEREAFYKVTYEMPHSKVVNLRPTYPPAPKGCRNHSMASYAGQLHGRGMTTREIYEEVWKANLAACTPPLSEREVQTIVNSIVRYER